jgi:hypothetical protein
MPVPDPCVRHWQRWGAKPGVKAKGRPSHPDKPAEGKMGRVNANEVRLEEAFSTLPTTVGSTGRRWIKQRLTFIRKA